MSPKQQRQVQLGSDSEKKMIEEGGETASPLFILFLSPKRSANQPY